MRLDVSVNMLTMQALTQRPHHRLRRRPDPAEHSYRRHHRPLHLFLLDNPQHTGVYNAGFENISILDIARMVAEHVPAEIVVTPSNDPRSYRINSDRLLATGFRPKKTVDDAISETDRHVPRRACSRTRIAGTI